jgi:predicted dehydrogenase
MKEVRLGIIGVGNMGQYHVQSALQGKISRCKLTAICDTDPAQMAPYPQVKHFTESEKLIRSGEVDAILIATPHYFHTTIGIDAFKNGLHVLTEKPLSVHKKDCERLIAAHTDKSKVFGVMFMTRTDPMWRKLKQLISSGALGEINRIHWEVTDWFRSDTYYASGGWRATWKGEGGGILSNQCPHNLDMWQWLFGMPSRITAFCNFGKRHAIEVEDEVTAYMEYASGCTAVFTATTGEAPGTNRLEIAAEMGRVVVQDGKIHFTRNEISTTEALRTSTDAYNPPPNWEIDIPTPGSGGAHNEVTQKFIDAILDGTPLIARAEEGIKAVELANAMVLSTLTNRTINLPMDSDEYEAKLKELIAGSKDKKSVGPKIASVPKYIKQ